MQRQVKHFTKAATVRKGNTLLFCSYLKTLTRVCLQAGEIRKDVNSLGDNECSSEYHNIIQN